MAHLMSVLDKSGDTKISWDSDKSDEVSAAKLVFDDLRKKGYFAFAVDMSGESERKGKQIKKFDPELSHIILVPQFVNG